MRVDASGGYAEWDGDPLPEPAVNQPRANARCAAPAFDGTNMWVANAGSGSVTELSPAGATLGTFAVGIEPDAIVFDGTNMWVANGGSGSVTELSPAT